jgi:3-oxoacyl-[acyl-carrier protein] reductase
MTDQTRFTYNLRGKVAIVTGGARGIGRGIAERLAREGAAVIVNYLANDEAATDTIRTITEAGGKARAVKANLSRLDEINRLFDETEAAFGGIDIVVANAATAIIKPFVEFTEEEYDRVFNVNAKGVFFIMQQAARRVRDGGRIIVVSTGGVRMLIPGNALRPMLRMQRSSSQAMRRAGLPGKSSVPEAASSSRNRDQPSGRAGVSQRPLRPVVLS